MQKIKKKEIVIFLFEHVTAICDDQDQNKLFAWLFMVTYVWGMMPHCRSFSVCYFRDSSCPTRTS